MRGYSICLLSLLMSSTWLRAADDAEVTLESAGFDLSHVTDRSELSFEDSAAYYGILDHARDVSAESLRAAADELRRQHWESSERYRDRPEAEFPTFVGLIEEPASYRGQPVTLSGHLIRLVKSSAGPNDFGINTLYEGWLVTENSQQHPATIICTEIPPGMPIGEELIDGVSVTGYFFKLQTYPSRDKKIRFAPLILAHSMSWNPPVEGAAGWSLSPFVLSLGVVLCTIATLIYFWLSARRHRRQRDVRYRESVPDDPPDFLESLTP